MEIPPEVFARRVDRTRRVLAERNLPALAVYSDLWRSNHARYFSNYMPYFNRALLLVPRDAPLALLCGLSPRVYGWIRSVTTIEDVRPAGNFAKPLFEIAAERSWTRIGILDADRLPYDLYHALHAGAAAMVNVESAAVFMPAEDESERAMRKRAAALAVEILDDEMPRAPGTLDHHFAGTLERRFRRGGAEDLVVLVTNGGTPPAPPSGLTLSPAFSVSVALEYRGHWVRLSRTLGPRTGVAATLVERLDGAYPYECGSGAITAVHSEYKEAGGRFFHGDTAL
jgi:hypothetical protein